MFMFMVVKFYKLVEYSFNIFIWVNEVFNDILNKIITIASIVYIIPCEFFASFFGKFVSLVEVFPPT